LCVGNVELSRFDSQSAGIELTRGGDALPCITGSQDNPRALLCQLTAHLEPDPSIATGYQRDSLFGHQ
jgi:hypothetical protein